MWQNASWARFLFMDVLLEANCSIIILPMFIWQIAAPLLKPALSRYFMVYIYKKIVSGKPYYYLRVSERKGKRVIARDIAYLGSSIEEVRRSLDKKEYRNIKDNRENTVWQ